jgi:transcriptional regulator with GAF, ATPase, and Fis domain
MMIAGARHAAVPYVTVTADPELETGTWISRAAGGAETLSVRKCRLEVISGPDAGATREIAAPIISIGRIGADLVLNDRKVSALHAEIRLEAKGYRVRDLGSTNGTFVWGMRIVEAFIGPGATIVCGDSAVRFVPLPDTVEVPLWEGNRLGGLLGQSPVMRDLFAKIDRIARVDTTVLINGETGTGKELVAEALHDRSSRAGGPFVVLDCASIPEQLFEDQLFGHEVGAFTGATRVTQGVFEAAHGGTLFLDEIGELPLAVQPKLLRAVETRRIKRIGGNQTIDCDVRLVAATNRDLAAEVNRGAFRSDLYFRLHVAHLMVPALRDRRDDIDLLIGHFLAKVPNPRPLSEEFVQWAKRQSWPGNVRELRNAVERSATTDLASLDEPPVSPGGTPFVVDTSLDFKTAKKKFVDEFDRTYIQTLLEAHDWNIASVSRAANIDRVSIYKMLRRLNLAREKK